jgi:hypothetical protein
LSQHRRIGWIVLILGLLHAAILLVAQPLIGHYLLPSAPLYMLLGLLALIFLAILVASGLSARTALRKASVKHASRGSAPLPTSVSTHAILAALLLGLIAAHVLGSHQLVDKPAKAITLCALLALPLLWAALRIALRRRALLPTVLPNCIAAAFLFLLPIPTATPHLLAPATPPSPLPAYFPHEKHTTVNCVTCHHNFVDKTGIGSCIDCHRSARPDLTESAEATFHTFCRTCHTDLAQTTSKHGPTRSCSSCHSPPVQARSPIKQAATDSRAKSVFSSR